VENERNPIRVNKNRIFIFLSFFKRYNDVIKDMIATPKRIVFREG